jgi:NAD(P)H dehydrogenase (quinone)
MQERIMPEKVKIAIVYSSTYGHTRLVAEHVTKGVRHMDHADTTLIEITAAGIGADGRWKDETTMHSLDAADAIVLGSPTYMGSAHGVFKLFLENAFVPTWVNQAWKDKIAAGFTNSASRSGDKLITLQQFAVFAAQMGMIWVGVGDQPGGNRVDSTNEDVNQLGSWLGLMTHAPSAMEGSDAKGSVSEGDLLTAERFGRRIARTALRWKLGAAAYPTFPLAISETRRRDRAGLAEWRTHND